jgi:Zn-finger nucleic acid-binding protein
MKNDKIALICELCPRETGVVLKLGDLRAKIPALREDPEDKQYRNGICPTCQAELESGCTFFIDEAGRCVKVSLEGTKEKIDPAYWGKVIKIPKSAMAELIKVWAKDNLKLVPPGENSQSGNGDVTPAGP